MIDAFSAAAGNLIEEGSSIDNSHEKMPYPKSVRQLSYIFQFAKFFQPPAPNPILYLLFNSATRSLRRVGCDGVRARL